MMAGRGSIGDYNGYVDPFEDFLFPHVCVDLLLDGYISIEYLWEYSTCCLTELKMAEDRGPDLGQFATLQSLHFPRRETNIL
jgi:hypothetical protein